MDENAFRELLERAADQDGAAVDRLFPLVYEELRRKAAHYLKSERGDHTLQPTALANEVYLRLAGRQEHAWQSRAHFMAVAARAMRAVLVDHARRRNARKRGGGQSAQRLTTVGLAGGAVVDFQDLDQALVDLARFSERQARVVELRYFGGLNIEEAAEVLGVSVMTVKRDWSTARAWLYRELSGTGPGTDRAD